MASRPENLFNHKSKRRKNNVHRSITALLANSYNDLIPGASISTRSLVKSKKAYEMPEGSVSRFRSGWSNQGWYADH